MKRDGISHEVIRQAVTQSTRDSATLADRTLPDGYVRDEKVAQFLAARAELESQAPNSGQPQAPTNQTSGPDTEPGGSEAPQKRDL